MLGAGHRIPALISSNPVELEAQLHRDLDLPHRGVVEQARNDASGGGADAGPRAGELRVIERIEKLQLQLMLEPIVEASVFHERQVGLGLTRVAENIAAGVSEIGRASCRERV